VSDETETCEGYYEVSQPVWKFSFWDVTGITLAGVAGVFSVLGQAGHLMAQQCGAMANWKRQTWDLEEARRLSDHARKQMADSLRKVVEGES
jgi:hypothetical protein